MSVEAFLKQGFIPFADAVRREVQVLSSVAPTIMQRAMDAARAVRAPEQVTFVGIGASLAALSAPAVVLSARKVPCVRLSAAAAGGTHCKGALVALSQSGRSKETVAVLRNARGPKLAIVNVTDSPLASAADAVLSLGDLPDSLASTIGYTASAMAVSMLCEAWTSGAPADSWLSLGERLGAFIEANASALVTIADLLSSSTFTDVVAPHEQSGIAEGGVLLIREVARKPAASFETRQYLHGLMEATSATTLHVVVDGPDDGQIVRALSSLRRDIAEFRTEPTQPASEVSTLVPVPAASPLELPIFVAVFLQHVVLRSALAREIDPNKFLFLDTGTKLSDSE